MQHKSINMKKIIFSALVLVIAATSCKKDKDEECTLSAASIQGTYKLSSVKYKASASVPEIEVLTNDLFFEPCERDDTYTLGSGNVFSYNDAGTSCTPSGSYSGTWGLTGSSLTINDGFDTFTLNVSSFACGSMTATASDFDVTGDQISFVFTRQ